MNDRSALFACWKALAASGLPKETKREGMRVLGAAINQSNQTGRKPRKRYTIDTPQFGVALDLAAGKIRYTDAVEAIKQLCCCEDRAAQKHLADMRDRAAVTLDFLQSLD